MHSFYMSISEAFSVKRGEKETKWEVSTGKKKNEGQKESGIELAYVILLCLFISV